jgi:hypothetical protein
MEQTLQGTNIPINLNPINPDSVPLSELHVQNQQENAKQSGIQETNRRVSRELNGYVVNPFHRDELLKTIEKEQQIYNELRSIRPTGQADTVLNESAKNVPINNVRTERLKFLAKVEKEKVLKRKDLESKEQTVDKYQLKKQEARQEAEKLKRLEEERQKKEQEKAANLRELMRKKYENY